MLAVLVVLFVVVPLLELWVIIEVGQAIGAWNTIGLLLLISVVGAWLVKREGLGVIRRFRQQLDEGRIPGRELADGVLIILAGALMLTPGFMTDVMGLILLLPFTRAGIRRTVLRRLSNKVYFRRY